MRSEFIVVTVGLLASSLAAGIAVAQKTPEVMVQATRLVETNTARSPSGVPISNISLAYGVNYSDLDLASHAGALELEKRVSNAALAACKEISRQYPEALPKEPECAKAATDKALVKVHELEAAAATKPR